VISVKTQGDRAAIMRTPKPLSAKALYRACDVRQFDFVSTDELEDISVATGQSRAMDALHFGLGIRRRGYNVFALGLPGIGKFSAVDEVVRELAGEQAVPSDWCYLHNFEDPRQPIALRLPAGRGMRLRKDMETLVEELGSVIPAAFDNEDTHARLAEIEEEFRERRTRALEELRRDGLKRGIAMVETPAGFTFAPIGEAKQILDPTQFQHLPEAEQKRIQEVVSELQEGLQKLLRQFQGWHKETREKLRDLQREITRFAVGHLIDALREQYADIAALQLHLDAVERDIVQHVSDFLQPGEGMVIPGIAALAQPAPALKRYQVNLLVDNSRCQGAPVVHESLPSHVNLIGSVEHQAQMGTLVTDFTLIKSGALHRANGGYLLLDAQKVLMQPLAWESLKRALQSQEIRIESPERSLGLVSTTSLEPHSIPLDVKVVLIGERYLYYFLHELDTDFNNLVKVAADFDDTIDRSPDNQLDFARLVATLARREGLKPLDRNAVGKVIERSSRIIEDGEKLSVHRRNLMDLLKEADYWAQQANHKRVGVGDIERAIEQQRHRLSRVKMRMQEEIKRGTVFIDTEGESVGQINGLSVLDHGDLMFGQPGRITATTRVGDGEIVDIEREIELGGPIHSKGVMILSSFLMSRYAGQHPISFTASLVFEQSYGSIDGDSASLAELCALLSSLASTPIRQSFAVTGSINQHGLVQPIGGVNEKIEGFYDVCESRGLSGDQGVIIPVANLKHLMVRSDIVDAVKKKQFRIFAVSTVDEAIQILTGVPAGDTLKKGGFSKGSINARVESRLIELSEIRREFGGKGDEGDKDGSDGH
jgi:lon-related putative ATP-dependent protease